MTAVAPERLVRAASLSELRAAGRLVVRLERHTLCVFGEGDEVYAVDNRCGSARIFVYLTGSSGGVVTIPA